MSTAYNNIVRSVAPKSLFESALPVLSTAVTYNQGDLIAFDTTNHILKPVAASGDATNLLGVARQTVVSGKIASPYQGTAVDASQAIEDFAGPVYGIVASLVLTTGDTISSGQKVYLTTSDPQTVTVTDTFGGGHNVGIYQGKAITSAPSGTFIDVLVGASYSLGGLQF
jgi:hypothetical protein